MDINVTGTRSRYVKDVIQQAADFYSTILLTKKMSSTIVLDVYLKKTLEDDAYGFCESIINTPEFKTFSIELLRTGKLSEILTTLAHEMVHVSQFARGVLSADAPGWAFKWKRSIYQLETKSMTQYANLPWEKEALSMERDLFRQYQRTYKDTFEDVDVA